MNRTMTSKVKITMFLLGVTSLLCACQGKESHNQEDAVLSERVQEEIMPTENMESDIASGIEQQEEKIRGSRELLEYLFNYLYNEEDLSKIINLELCETEDQLYYEWHFLRGEDKIPEPAPTRLELCAISPDGLWQNFAVCWEIWSTWLDKEGADQSEYIKDEYGEFWLVNRDTKEVIPWRFYEEDLENDVIHIIDNERYLEILEYYEEYGGFIFSPFYNEDHKEK